MNKILFLLSAMLITVSSFAQNQWDIQLTRNTLDCENNQVCYQLEVKNTSGNDWTLGDQNYRFFFDGDLMTVNSVTSLLPSTHYGNAIIDQNIKIEGQGQEAASPLDDIDNNLGFLDFGIVQTNKTNPAAATIVNATTFTPVAVICVDTDPSVMSDQTGSNCLSFYHSRPSNAGSITNQYTTISENNVSGSTTTAMGTNYDDLTSADGTAACVGMDCITQNQWDIQLTRNTLDCENNQVCYQLEVKNTSGDDWTLGDQNYRLFFDGDLMTVNSVTSLLPSSHYGSAMIDQNIKITGQEAGSPLDDIDNNLGFLDFGIVQTNKTNPAAATIVNATTFTPVAVICVDTDPSVMSDQTDSNCLSFHHSRPSNAGTITNQYTTISENNMVGSTTTAMGINYDDLTSVDGAAACVGMDCSIENQWDIQLTRNTLDCENNQVCYQLEVKNTSGSDWTLGDQNYRLFFDGDLMTVNSVTSLLPSTYYGSAMIDQNIKITGQEGSSPLDDIDNNLGFLDFGIVQTNKTNPAAATLVNATTFTPVAVICVDTDPSVMSDQTGSNCLNFYHSRPSNAGTITNQYTTISENNMAGSTTTSMGTNFDDLTSADGATACVGMDCAVACPPKICLPVRIVINSNN